MSEAHEAAIEAHRKKIGASKMHVDYNPSCDPAALAQELDKMQSKMEQFSSVPYVDLLESHIEILEAKLKRLSPHSKWHFKVDPIPTGELAKIKNAIFQEIDMLQTLHTQEAIEYSEGVRNGNRKRIWISDRGNR